MKVLAAVISLTSVVLSAQPLLAQVQGQWTSSGAMQSPRELNAQAPTAGGKVLSAGGVDNTGTLLATAEVYSPILGSWTLTGSMAAARELFPAVLLTNGNILVSGGLGAGGTVLDGAELFNPKTGTWSPAGTMSVARFDHSATLLKNGKVLVTGGCTTSNCGTVTPVGELYDPQSNSWTTTGSLGTARYRHAAVRLNDGRVLAIGGLAGGATTSCELYDPTTGIWSSAASTATARYLNGATLLPDGKVLVTGGVITRYPLNSAELYNPATNAWTPAGTMTAGRYAHTSTLLPDGTVLLAGGEGQSISCGKDCTGYIPTAKTEIYNEATGTFAAAASLPRALAYHTTTLAGAGRALTGGGLGYNAYCCQVVSNSAYYIPLTTAYSAYSLNFGLLQIGLSSTAQMVTVTNVSSHATMFSSIASIGEYSETNSCVPTLNAGQQCTISVTFKPTKAGTSAGTLIIRDDDPGSPTQTITLAGTGETLALGFTPASLNLGSVPVGSSGMESATMTNDGPAPVDITGIAISPANHTFTQTNNCPATLNVQQTCTFQIVFSPPDVFTYNATLSVMIGAGGMATLRLSGTGLDGP